jgi:hypothetical protein
VPGHEALKFQEREYQVRDDDFAVRRSPDGRWYTITGACPQCKGPTVFRVAHGVLGPAKGWFGRSRVPAPLEGAVLVYCQCGFPHEERPAEASETGCGAFWDVPVQGAQAQGAQVQP